MAYDKTTTSNKAIVIGGITAAVILFALHFVFDSYFISVTEEAKHEKMASPEQLIKTREGERKALASLDGAMQQLARQGRAGATGAADITPKQSDDIGALSGWNKMPQKAEPFVGSQPAELAGSLSNNPTDADAGAAAVNAATADAGANNAGIPLDAGQADAGAYTPQR